MWKWLFNFHITTPDSYRDSHFHICIQNLFFHIILSTGLSGWLLYLEFFFWLYLISISPSTGK